MRKRLIACVLSALALLSVATQAADLGLPAPAASRSQRFT